MPVVFEQFCSLCVSQGIPEPSKRMFVHVRRLYRTGAKHYVPDSKDVLVFTDMVNPKAETTIHFTAPLEKGVYPYLCTFPGHWMVMNGVMKVE